MVELSLCDGGGFIVRLPSGITLTHRVMASSSTGVMGAFLVAYAAGEGIATLRLKNPQDFLRVVADVRERVDLAHYLLLNTTTCATFKLPHR